MFLTICSLPVVVGSKKGSRCPGLAKHRFNFMKKFKQIFDDTYLKPSYKFDEKKVFKFTWDYCELCDNMFVRCPKCGNNCCNGGFGKVTKNKELPTNKWDSTTTDCNVCNLAYMYQELAYKMKCVPKKYEIKTKN